MRWTMRADDASPTRAGGQDQQTFSFGSEEQNAERKRTASHSSQQEEGGLLTNAVSTIGQALIAVEHVVEDAGVVLITSETFIL